MSPTFSVIIPAYNNAEFLGEAIQSVLDQTYPDFEAIVVNDASPEDISPVIARFHDPRLKYIIHDQNKGLAAARNTGIRSSQGEYIAFLDGDDIFHPDKLRLHAEFLNHHPDIGVTYNPRYELNHSSRTIREIWRPPLAVSLSDLVLGFPFSPSDMVIEREWLLKVDLFDEQYTYFGEDLDLNCRLALAGCEFRSVDRALNYRRYHADRRIRNLAEYRRADMEPLLNVFDDPRCPPEVAALYANAISNRYIGWTYVAFAQSENGLGTEYCIEAVRLNPSIGDGNPCPLVEALVGFSVLDESRDHEELVTRIVEQLSSRVISLRPQQKWTIARGYLLKGARAIVWGRLADGERHFARARALGAEVDQHFLQQLTVQLLSFARELGQEAAEEVLRDLAPQLETVGGYASKRAFVGSYSINRAFQNYTAQMYTKVFGDILKAIVNDPSYMTNHGVHAITMRSAWAIIKQIGMRSPPLPAAVHT